MNSLHYLRWPLIIFLTGGFLWFTAMLYKIRHWPLADELFLIAWIIISIGLFTAIIKLIVLKKIKQVNF